MKPHAGGPLAIQAVWRLNGSTIVQGIGSIANEQKGWIIK